MAGGREIWGFPKELAQFTWQTREQNQVYARAPNQRWPKRKIPN
jgi:hypothetical protein